VLGDAIREESMGGEKLQIWPWFQGANAFELLWVGIGLRGNGSVYVANGPEHDRHSDLPNCVLSSLVS
jgi:hypothetical protein